LCRWFIFHFRRHHGEQEQEQQQQQDITETMGAHHRGVLKMTFLFCLVGSSLLYGWWSTISSQDDFTSTAVLLQLSVEEERIVLGVPGSPPKPSLLLDQVGAGSSETSPLYWETIQDFATNVREGAFCLPWSVNSDLWWTHHPEWNIFDESDSHYCFQQMQESRKKNFLRNVYRHQFSNANNCSNVFTAKMWSSGWGADVENLINSMRYAMLRGRPMEIHQAPWHYAAPDQTGKNNTIPSKAACPLHTMYCYFLKLSSCDQKPADEYSREYDYRTNRPMPTQHNKWLRDYVVRPQTWLRRKVYEFVQNQTIVQPCTVMHVRRSDVVRHAFLSRKYHAISEYLNASSTGGGMGPTIYPNIFLLTDDHNAIGEATTLYPNKNWMFLNRPRWRADEGGWEHQIPSSDPAFEMRVLLSTFQLVKQCQSFVYSTSSFAEWLKYEMQQANKSIAVYDLDAGTPNPRNPSNAKTKVVSQSYETKMEH
jgi:hypothetical protein